MQSEREADAVEEAVRAINQAAEVLRTRNSRADFSRLFDIRTLRPESALRLPPPPPRASFARGAERLLAQVHDAAIGTVCLELPGELSEPRFVAWLETLLWEPESSSAGAGSSPPEVLRAKAVLRFSGRGGVRVLQAVRQTYDLSDGAQALEGGEGSRLVLIGRGLDEKRLRASIVEACGGAGPAAGCSSD